MIQIEPYSSKIYAVYWDEVKEFKNTHAAISALHKLGKGHLRFVLATGSLRVFDEFGDDARWILGAAPSKKKEVFINGPVPGVSKSRGGYSSWYKRPKSARRKRQAFFFKEEGEPEVKPKHRVNAIRSAWDDDKRTVERSWKSHRKHQYK